MRLESLERRIAEVESVLIGLTIVTIAAGDHFVGQSTSLGPLYLIPLSYSALTHSLRTTLLLAGLCVALRQWFGPIGNAADPASVFLRDLGVTVLFMAPVVYLHRLGRRRRAFFEQARRQRDELEHEVAMAAALQERMLASGDSPGDALEVVARTVPLRGVGGDYYDLIRDAEGRVFVVVADVAGKGLPAAMLMPAVRIGLRAAAARSRDLVSAVTELNRILFQTTEAASYATLFIVGIDPETGELTYVNAGHQPGLLVEENGDSRWLDRGGVPVGLLEGPAYESGRDRLGEGAVLVVCTDGVTEAENASGEEFGLSRLEVVVRRERAGSAEQLVSAIHDEAKRFVGSMEPVDDTTVVALKRPARD